MPATLARQTLWGRATAEQPALEEVAQSQRRRLLLGMARAVARLGYAETRVADVIEEAGVSRRTFYEMFRDKEDCYLAAYERAHAELVEGIKQSQIGIVDAIQRAETAHRSLLERIRDYPDSASAFLVGVLEAGPRASERRQRANLEFAGMHASLHKLLRRQHPELPNVPRQALMALAAGTNIVVVNELRKHGGARLMELLPTVLYLSYSVYGLHERAASALK